MISLYNHLQYWKELVVCKRWTQQLVSERVKRCGNRIYCRNCLFFFFFSFRKICLKVFLRISNFCWNRKRAENQGFYASWQFDGPLCTAEN